MTPRITAEISPGDLLDRISILEIKNERLKDDAKRANVLVELRSLSDSRDLAIKMTDELASLTARLKEINEQLWDIEDDIRECERRKEFGQTFIRLARSVYQTNDQRATVKRQVNEMLGSAIVEEKEYVDYNGDKG